MKHAVLGLALVVSLAVAAPSVAAAPPIVAKPLAVGMIKATTIKAQSGAAILEQITIAPGGSFGWHRHGAPVAVVVAKGTLTVMDPTIGNCAHRVQGSVVRRAGGSSISRGTTRGPGSGVRDVSRRLKPALANAMSPPRCSA
jgi:hypothetical protein